MGLWVGTISTQLGRYCHSSRLHHDRAFNSLWEKRSSQHDKDLHNQTGRCSLYCTATADINHVAPLQVVLVRLGCCKQKGGSLHSFGRVTGQPCKSVNKAGIEAYTAVPAL